MAGTLTPGTILPPNNALTPDKFQLKHDDGTIEPIRLKILEGSNTVVAEPYSKTN